ncbi:predicted protein [Lichtheimia corymbifera JMRC:FSU:9682]|uniref:Uncharacterized protein n=1 Tax=Lichtheimia corymbifera JMRC:FSU:9682 TaxID=1263082 RepID=A0A068RP68_9FUNG|nr:predicted protein [Lichtheimia corymbifera JMRC:FSU:9682]
MILQAILQRRHEKLHDQIATKMGFLFIVILLSLSSLFFVIFDYRERATAHIPFTKFGLPSGAARSSHRTNWTPQ